MSIRCPADTCMTVPALITETMSERPEFSRFFECIRIAGLDTVLAKTGPFTVCAPTNEAFEQLPLTTLTAIQEDPQGLLFRTLQYHILFGNLSSVTMKKLNFPKTRLGTTVEITEKNGLVMYGNATVIIPDIICSNGMIQGIDRVVLPTNLNIPTLTKQ